MDERVADRRRKFTLAALSAFASACVALGAWMWTRRDAPAPSAPLAIVRAMDANELAARLRARDQRSPPVPLRALSTSTLARQRLEPDLARLLFPMLAQPELAYDADCYFRHAGGQSRWVPFAELEGGGFRFATNALGLREDADPAEPGPSRWLLVTGDSHVDGACANEATFPNRVERALRGRLDARPGEPALEVWNAATAGFTFYNYLGVLERFRARKPLGFVLVCFGGNDFYDLPRLSRFFRRADPYAGDDAWGARLRALEEGPPRRLHYALQGPQQAAWFARHPDQADEAVGVAIEISAEIAAICRADAIRLLCVYLPPAQDVQPAHYREGLAETFTTLGLEPARAHAADALADRWLADLRARGVECLDLREAFRTCPEPLYWQADLHLDTRGHELVAEQVARAVEPWLAAPR